MQHEFCLSSFFPLFLCNLKNFFSLIWIHNVSKWNIIHYVYTSTHWLKLVSTSITNDHRGNVHVFLYEDVPSNLFESFMYWKLSETKGLLVQIVNCEINFICISFKNHIQTIFTMQIYASLVRVVSDYSICNISRSNFAVSSFAVTPPKSLFVLKELMICEYRVNKMENEKVYRIWVVR